MAFFPQYTNSGLGLDIGNSFGRNPYSIPGLARVNPYRRHVMPNWQALAMQRLRRLNRLPGVAPIPQPISPIVPPVLPPFPDYGLRDGPSYGLPQTNYQRMGY